MAQFICPNDGPFEADPEVRSTTPTRSVKIDPSNPEHEAAAEAQGSRADQPGNDKVALPAAFVIVDTDDEGNKVVVSEHAAGESVEVPIGVCPVCGSPIVGESPPQYELV